MLVYGSCGGLQRGDVRKTEFDRSLEVIPIYSRPFLPLFIALIVALLLPAPVRSAATPDVPFLGDVYELQAPTQQVLETAHKRVADKAVIQSLDDDYNDLRASVNGLLERI